MSLIVLLVVVVFAFWVAPGVAAAVSYAFELKGLGLSTHEVLEALFSDARRMFDIAVAMRRGCGAPCHEYFCRLDPLGESPHRCHVTDCAGIRRDD